MVLLNSLSISGVKLRRAGPAGIQLNFSGESICVDVPEPYDCHYALYTHNHPKHTPKVLPSIPLYSPFAGNKVSPGDNIEILGGLRVMVTHAYNAGYREEARHPKGFGVGYILFFQDGPVIYYMGDSDLVEELLLLRETIIDVLIAPIGGNGVMSPEEASEAVKTLRPAIAIPVHEENPYQAKIFKRLSQPYTQVILLGAEKNEH